MNYYEIDYVADYNPKTMSAKISCDNMSSLSCAYTSQQNYLFADKINMDICNYHNNLKKGEYREYYNNGKLFKNEII